MALLPTGIHGNIRYVQYKLGAANTALGTPAIAMVVLTARFWWLGDALATKTAPGTALG